VAGDWSQEASNKAVASRGKAKADNFMGGRLREGRFSANKDKHNCPAARHGVAAGAQSPEGNRFRAAAQKEKQATRR
jgi:hypothetical protein